MRIRAKVTPNSKRFSFKMESICLKIFASEKPERGRVNIEIIKTLGKILKTQVSIVAGQTSRNKILEIEGDEEEILRRIRESIGRSKGDS